MLCKKHGGTTMEYFYNLGQVSKKLVDKDKRIEESCSSYAFLA